MFIKTATQPSARAKRGAVLCVLVLIFSLSLVFAQPTLAQDNVVSQRENKSLVTQVWDWGVNVWNNVTSWIIEQGTHLARALFSQRLTTLWVAQDEVAQVPQAEPQVLGEEATPPEAIASPSTPHPTPLLREEREPENAQVVEPVPVETEPIVDNNQTPITNNQENTNNQFPILESEPAEVVTPAPQPELVPDTSPEPTPAPVPDSTPEILSEPVKPSGPSFIPILARDFVAPISAVSSLASVMESAAFTVSWTGQDADVTATPEIKSYDIQYQVDSGAWTDWLLETVLLSSSFTGENAKTYGFRSRARDRYGNLEEYPSSADASTYMELTPSYEVIINEIAWMGTRADSSHEWIELYNPGNSTVDLNNWTLKSEDGTPSITIASGKTIAAKSYFLLERAEAATNVASDQIFTDELGDGGELLVLRNSSGRLVDKAGSSSLAWFAGDNSSAANRATMERKNPTSDGTASSNWATNDGTFITGQDSGANNIKGTPKSLNSQNTTIPRSITDLQMQFIYTTANSVRLYWTTPKNADSTATTTSPSYDIRYSTSLITESNFSLATSVTSLLTPSATEGTVATTTVSGLATSTPYYFAIKTNNGAETSGISNIYTGTTEDGNYVTYNSYPVGTGGLLASSTSPYLITGNISIPNSSSLVIQPGAVVKLAAGVSITFGSSSTLTIGSASDSVNAAVITSKNDNTYSTPASGSTGSPAAGDWGKIQGGTGAVVNINRGIISYGGGVINTPMMTFSAGTITVNSSIISYSNNHGLIVGGAATTLNMASSTVSNMLDVGVGITSSAIANIQESTFTGNRRGISVDTPAVEGSITITGNNFYANNATTGDGTKPISGLHYADTDTLTAENNWWGSSSGPSTSSPDTDATQDAAMSTGGGTIDYAPYATSAFSILPSNL